MKILVTGKNGQLGKSIHEIVANNKQINEFVFVGRDELDFSQNDNITKYFEENNFDVIINCAAYTAVDKAESETKLANQINNLAIEKLATIAQKNNIKLIHISTDYVFDGNSIRPYIESAVPNAVNTYGRSKLFGEEAIQKSMLNNSIIIRTSWLYSEHGNNFVKTMLKLGTSKKRINVVDDQIGSPTYALDLAQAIIHIISHDNFVKTAFKTQIYHYSNSGFCSWCEFAKEIFKLANIQCLVNPITTDDYPLPATRPMFTALDSQKIIDDFDLKTPEWKESIGKFIKLLE
jgi:dTDP-4-dehydrorhamnose reductase